MHLTLLPYLKASGELKTKPTQHSVKELQSIGIAPDILVCRSEYSIPQKEREKLALFCNVRPESVIAAYDLSSIYDAPLAYHKEGLDQAVLNAFEITPAPKPNLGVWEDVSDRIHNRVKVKIGWLDSEALDTKSLEPHLEGYDGILVPGGFGERGTEGMIKAVTYSREQNIPFLGICLGMQMAVIETSRNLAQIENAGSEEFDHEANKKRFTPVVYHLKEWVEGNRTIKRDATDNKGGTMRLGAYNAILKKNSMISKIYGNNSISERHRHRYEVDLKFRDKLEACGLSFSGMSPDDRLPEIVEMKNHPWFIGVQFHPELKSKPFEPHPLFADFIRAAVERSKLIS